MRKVLHFTSTREEYTCDAAVVWCFDQRFEAVLRKVLKRLAVVHPDHIRVAGGARNLASPQQEGDRLFVLDQIRKSIRLHKTRTVVLMLHSDCGAYGGLAAFQNDAEKEARNHSSDLQKAAEFLNQEIPEIAVKCYFVDFEGIWEVEPAGKSQSAAWT
jgi:carbonic anhydrase